MACQLTPLPVPPPHFQGPIDGSVTLGVVGSAAAAMVSVVYGGAPTGNDWTFAIVAGPVGLEVTVSDQPGQAMQIVEVCNGANNVLRSFVFFGGAPQAFIVLGI